MRIKNKEIRQRRHRKEQVIKAANKALAAQYADKKVAVEKKPAAPKAEPKPKAPAKKKAAE